MKALIFKPITKSLIILKSLMLLIFLTVSSGLTAQNDTTILITGKKNLYDSGGKSLPYALNEDYSVTLKAGKGYNIILSVINTDLGSGDYLSLFDPQNPENTLIHSFSGYNPIRKTFLSSGDEFIITFKSDDENNGNGWVIMATPLQRNNGPTQKNITVNSNAPYNSADYLVQNVLVTGCLTAWNVQSAGDPSQMGYFDGTACPIVGFENGIVLGTGVIGDYVPGPNGWNDEYSDPGTPGDDLLREVSLAITGYTPVPGEEYTYNAAVIEFDFEPQSSSLDFRYVFASAEYPDFNCSQFNDIFGFFLSGPDPSGGNYVNKNIATVPGTTDIPVCVNSINNGFPDPFGDASLCEAIDPNWESNTIYFQANPDGAANFGLDGLTVPLTAHADVIPCETYHIKLAIADVGDASYESAVFLEANGFAGGEGVQISYTSATGSEDAMEGCDFTVTFSRTDLDDMTAPIDIAYTVEGTATPGTDYTALPASVTIPAGQESISFSLSAMSDGITEGTETIILALEAGQFCPCDGGGLSEFTIEILESPLQVTFAEVADICPGESANITATISTPSFGPYTYNWGTGTPYTGTDLSQTTSVSPVSPGGYPYTQTYYVTVTDLCGNDAVAGVPVTVLSCSFVTIDLTSSQSQVCEDGCSQITATIGGEYTAPCSVVWSPALPSTVGPHNVCPGSTTTYTATVTDADGNVDTESITITVITVTPGSTINNNALCFGDCNGSATLSGTGGIEPCSYSWPGGATTATVNDLCAGSYQPTITDALGCSASISITITQPTALITSITPEDLLCYGDTDGSADLTVSGGTSPYEYHWEHGPTTQDVSGLSEGTYQVTITDHNGCTATQSVSISGVNDPLVVTTSGTNLICYRDHSGKAKVESVTGGTPGYNYLWSNGSNLPEITGLSAGTYYVTVTDANGCKKTVPQTITEPSPLGVNLPGDFYICGDPGASITAMTYGGTPDYTYLWSTGSTSATITDNPVQTTLYTITVTDSHNCTATQSITIGVYPQIVFNTYLHTDTVCPGEPVYISGNYYGGTGGPYTITLDGEIVALPMTVHPNAMENLTFMIKDECDNFATSSEIIYTYPVPPLSVISDIYKGCQPLEVQFNEMNDCPGCSYVWDFDDIHHVNLSLDHNPVHTFSEPGTYSVNVNVTDQNGCKNSLTITDMITVYPLPTSNFYADPLVMSIVNPSTQFINNSAGAYEYIWSFGDGDSSLYEEPNHTYSEVGEYNVQLIAITEMGCRDTAGIMVIVKDEYVIYAPTGFSPNDDGYNDLFLLYGSGIEETNFYLFIYDRWGELIFEADRMDIPWDGRAKNNQKVPTGCYVWMAKYQDLFGNLHEKAGTITVLE